MASEITTTATYASVPKAPSPGSTRVQYPRSQASHQYTVLAHKPTPRNSA